jgi:hypothetical protein
MTFCVGLARRIRRLVPQQSGQRRRNELKVVLPTRGTATAGRQPPASAAAGTMRGNVGASIQRPGALRATGVTPTST